MLNRIWIILVWPWFGINNAKNVTLTGRFLILSGIKGKT